MSATPLILVLPGGGYSMLADHEAEPVAAWLHGLGWDAEVLRYPIAPARYPEALDTVRRRIRELRASGRERIGVLGFSAGGHLAGSVALTPGEAGERPDFAVLCYPVVSMIDDPHEGSLENLLGDQRHLAGDVSLERLVTPDAPPIFLWHTADDEAVPVRHSYVLAQALAERHVPHELHVFPHGPHGIGLAGGFGAPAAWTALCAEWLRATAPSQPHSRPHLTGAALSTIGVR
ncbi:alpha/beta hydrolase [Lysobacter korlensis]|uniref:Alpha/beta hydrolase n=1 Tax=Lysobacter korlensis TaxID=553636 RepID=A0ABV6RTA8_9GAMM